MKRGILVFAMALIVSFIVIFSLTSGVLGAGDNNARIKSAALEHPDDMSFIIIDPDIVTTDNPTLHAYWNFTSLTWDKSKYPDCYIRIYGDEHLCIDNWPFETCPLEFKIKDPDKVDKTGSMDIDVQTIVPEGVYYINLQCEVMHGEANTTVPYESVNLDVVPVFVSSNPTDETRATMVPRARAYMDCETLPNVRNCKDWQRQVTSGGKSWNQTWGNEV